MTKFKAMDQVKWVKRMACVPHPERKTDISGNILPVFRDKEIIGKIISKCMNGKWVVRPDSTEGFADKLCGERYYDVQIDEKDILSL